MNIWCERCNGSGGIDKQTMSGLPYKEKCPRCRGKGYTENTELEHFAKIGKATKKAFNEQSCVLLIDSVKGVEECYEFELTNTQQLLEWAESEVIYEKKNM